MKGKENHRPRRRGGKFWIKFFFGLLFFCMLCHMICRLNSIDEEIKNIGKKIDDIESCCTPVSVNNNICIDTFITTKVNPLDFNQTILDTIFQRYKCNEIVVTGISTSNKVRVESVLRDSGFVKLKTCACDIIQTWGKDKPLTPEEKGQVCRSELGQEGDGFSTSLNYLVDIPDTGLVEGGDNFETTLKDDDLKTVRVALIDTGIDFEHDSLERFEWSNIEEQNGRLDRDDDIIPNCLNDDKLGYDFANESTNVTDINGHGTHIAGIITKKENMNFNVELMNLKIIGEKGGELFHLLCALQYAIDKEADIINLSLGYYAPDKSFTLSDMLKKAENDSILVVTSAGNKGLNNDNITIIDGSQVFHYPSSFYIDYDNILSVAALESSSLPRLWDDSNYGQNHVNLATQGEKIVSTYIDLGRNPRPNPSGMLSGTSMAAGQISHIATILLSRNSNLNSMDAKRCIEYNADPNSIGGNRKIKMGSVTSILDISSCN